MTFVKLPKQKWILMNSNLYKFKCIQPIKIQGFHVLTCFLVVLSFDSEEVPSSAELHLPSASAILWPCVFAMLKRPEIITKQISKEVDQQDDIILIVHVYIHLYTYILYIRISREILIGINDVCTFPQLRHPCHHKFNEHWRLYNSRAAECLTKKNHVPNPKTSKKNTKSTHSQGFFVDSLRL